MLLKRLRVAFLGKQNKAYLCIDLFHSLLWENHNGFFGKKFVVVLLTCVKLKDED